MKLTAREQLLNEARDELVRLEAEEPSPADLLDAIRGDLGAMLARIDEHFGHSNIVDRALTEFVDRMERERGEAS